MRTLQGCWAANLLLKGCNDSAVDECMPGSIQHPLQVMQDHQLPILCLLHVCAYRQGHQQLALMPVCVIATNITELTL